MIVTVSSKIASEKADCSQTCFQSNRSVNFIIQVVLSYFTWDISNINSSRNDGEKITETVLFQLYCNSISNRHRTCSKIPVIELNLNWITYFMSFCWLLSKGQNKNPVDKSNWVTNLQIEFMDLFLNNL